MGLNTGALQQKQEEIEKKRKESMGKEFFNLEEKKNTVRILPRSLKYFSVEKDDDFAVRYFVHYNLFDVDGFKMVVCRKTLNQVCPICEEVSKLKDKVLLGRVRARERFTYNVFDFEDGKIKILETGPKIYEEVLKFVLNPEWGDLFGLKDGRNITIEKISAEKSGTGWNEYTVVPSPMPSDITESLPENWDEEIDKLFERIPTIFDEAELKRLADCFKNGTSPAKLEQEKRKDVTKERQSNGVAPDKLDRPECFGEKYLPRDQKCKDCKVKDDCRAKYLSV